MKPIPSQFLDTKNSFMSLLSNKFAASDFMPAQSEAHTLVCKTTYGQYIISFRFYAAKRDSRLMTRAFFGYSHEMIQKMLAEFNDEPFADDEEVLTITIGGHRNYFIEDRKLSIDITYKTKHAELVEKLYEDYQSSIQDYLDRFVDVEGVLKQFRNPDNLTKRLIDSALRQSHIIMIAAYLTGNASYFYTILEQEARWFKENQPDFYASYEKLSQFLLDKKHGDSG